MREREVIQRLRRIVGQSARRGIGGDLTQAGEDVALVHA